MTVHIREGTRFIAEIPAGAVYMYGSGLWIMIPPDSGFNGVPHVLRKQPDDTYSWVPIELNRTTPTE